MTGVDNTKGTGKYISTLANKAVSRMYTCEKSLHVYTGTEQLNK